MEVTEDGNSKSHFPAYEPDQELYTIPSSSGWFTWDDIDETERQSLKEFFNWSSISKTPKIYKEYRDFIINKYREDPKRRLKFTEIRKSLIGDVSLIYKVYCVLEKWGLINFGVVEKVGGDSWSVDEESDKKVVFEEGAPNGVRVVAFPNSSRPVVGSGNGEGVVESGLRLPPLASCNDVFGGGLKGLSCVKCGEVFASKSGEANKKENAVTCLKCLKNGNIEESKSENDVNFKDSKDGSDNCEVDSWTETEILLLLESVLLHGDDWDLVARDVKTKKRSDCISKLIQLPFGELMLNTTNGKGDGRKSNSSTINIAQGQSTQIELQDLIKEKDLCHYQVSESDQNGDGETEEPPLKRRCIDRLADASDSLMKQVAHLSTVVSPHVAAAAAKAAMAALCEENPYARVYFEDVGDDITNVLDSPTSSSKATSLLNVEDSEMVERHAQSESQVGDAEKNPIALTLRIKTAIGTAFGAAAAHAKLLADQEDREIEHLVATVIETQLRKIQCKIKHFEELQLIMENEYTQIQELKESLLVDRVDVLRRVFSAGIARWRDHHSSVKLT